MNRLTIISIAWLAISAAASTVAVASTTFGTNELAPPSGAPIAAPEVNTVEPDLDLTFTLDPTAEVYPPGADTTTCQITGAAPCVYFSGTLTDTDTDDSFLFLESIAIIYTSPTDADYFTLDNTFYDFYQSSPSGPPGVLSGDPTWATDGLGNPPNSYGPGLIFGVDIISPPPVGVYVETAEITACNIPNDSTCQSGGADPGAITVDAQFTISVIPEPASGWMMLAGLLGIVGLNRARRSRIAGR
jgi:hypothetical protein